MFGLLLLLLLLQSGEMCCVVGRRGGGGMHLLLLLLLLVRMRMVRMWRIVRDGQVMRTEAADGRRRRSEQSRIHTGR